MSKQDIESRVDQTLDAFKQEVPPPMDPWFFERMVNRITRPTVDTRESYEFIIGRVLRSGLLTGLAAFNILMVIWLFDAQVSHSSGRESYIESLSSQYGLNYSDSYLLSQSKE